MPSIVSVHLASLISSSNVESFILMSFDTWYNAVNIINKITRSNYELSLNNRASKKDAAKNAILRAVLNAECLSNKKLKERIESKEYLDRTLSPDTYNSYLKEMVHNGYLKKEHSDKQNGTNERIFYSLTPKALGKAQLGLPLNSERNRIAKRKKKILAIGKQENVEDIDNIRQQTFELLLSIAVFHDYHTLIGEDDFDKLLSDVGISRDSLIVEEVSRDSLDTINTWFKPIYDIRIHKVELSSRTQRIENNKIFYYVKLPGISKSEFLHALGRGNQQVGNIFGHIKHSASDVDEYFESLKRDGLIELLKPPSLRFFRGETRYDIKDINLRKFLESYHVLSGQIRLKLDYAFGYLKSRASPAERDFLDGFYGINYTNDYLHNAFDSRRKLKATVDAKELKELKIYAKKIVKQQNKGSIEPLFGILKKQYASTIEKYSYLLEKPIQRIQQIIEEEENQLKRYKNKRIH